MSSRTGRVDEADAQVAAALGRDGDRERPTALIAVALIGLDAVRGINGRPAASVAVSEIRRRLLTDLGADGATVIPLDGDDLAVVCPGTDESGAFPIAERIVDLVGEPTDGEHPVRLTANIGVTVSAPDRRSSAQLLRDADTALAAAISCGPGSIETFEPEMREALAARMNTAVELAEALAAGGQLFLQYQPVLDLTTGSLVGAEALARWQHPVRGLVSPAEFIPVAEETGLITALGRWVLDAAVEQLAEWQPLARPNFRLHVNLSPMELHQPRLREQVAETLDRHDAHARQLLLEITETGLMTSNGAPIARLQELRDLGVAVGIDDFGTGYSSISYLRELPVDMVKLDRSLTALVASSTHEYALTRAIFGLMRSSGLETVAEGIEEHIQVAHLRAMRCRYGQGFLLARPAGPELVSGLLRSHDN